MIPGFNTDVTYKGVVFHIQTEDKGLRNPKVESLVYQKGTILFAKTTPYDEILSAENQQEIIQAIMEEQHHQIMEEISKGKFYKGGREETKAVGLEFLKEDKSLDELILDYLSKKTEAK